VISELVIDVQPQIISIAVLEDKNLVEFRKEVRDLSFSVGNIYLGRVKKMMPGLNAAFVDIGGEKGAFLHYRDLGGNINSLNTFLKKVFSEKRIPPIGKFLCSSAEVAKDISITDILKQGDNVLVQIVKEPIATKGPRLTSELSIVGRCLIVIPFGDRVSISLKIQSDKERIRLKQLVCSIKPKNFSVIVRTSAKGKQASELDKELKILVKRWNDNIVKLINSKSPSLIYEETGRVLALLRDNFDSSFEHIYINDENMFNEVRDYLSLIDPQKSNIVKLYKGEFPIFDNFVITKQLKSKFGKIITLKNGAYLVIEHTEAMYVIDVNSGNRLALTANTNQEDVIVDVNMSAAEEIAKQLRLRDMGGIIVIDFIDMYEQVNRQKLYDSMCNFMAKDRAKHHVFPLSKVGLMEITRKRIRPALDFNAMETCSVPLGKGTIKPSIFFTDMLDEKIKIVVKKMGVKEFSLHIHPYVAAFVKKGFFSLNMKWKIKYSVGIRIIPDQSLEILGYKFFNKKKEGINI
jgi:ribonuclease G